MRDDRLGIHRECRRLFFFWIVYERGLQTGRSFDPWKVVQSAEPILVGAGFQLCLVLGFGEGRSMACAKTYRVCVCDVGV